MPGAPASPTRPHAAGRSSVLVRIWHVLAAQGTQLLLWARHWWRLLFIGAQVIVLAFSPSSYHSGSVRRVARQMYLATAPGLRAFTVLMALFSAVMIRVIVSGAASFGLSGMALSFVMHTLVLELIPLAVSLYVAIRYTVPGGNELFRTRRAQVQRASGRVQVRQLLGLEVLPRVLAGVFAVSFLGLLSTWIALGLTYTVIYGFNHWGLQPFTRSVGQILTPAVSMIFVIKILLFSLIVAVLPVGAAMQDWRGATRTSVELQGLVRMLALLLLVEAVSLIGNYY
jgi:phospholipid/cholesterol/gamma-HCH transport system permease protein